MQISAAERMNPNDGGEPTMEVHMLVVLSQISQNLLVSQLQFDCVIYCVMVLSSSLFFHVYFCCFGLECGVIMRVCDHVV